MFVQETTLEKTAATTPSLDYTANAVKYTQQHLDRQLFMLGRHKQSRKETIALMLCAMFPARLVSDWLCVVFHVRDVIDNCDWFLKIEKYASQ